MLPSGVDGGIVTMVASRAGRRETEEPRSPIVDAAHPVYVLAVLIESGAKHVRRGVIGEGPVFTACETGSTIACLPWDRTFEKTAPHSHHVRWWCPKRS